MKKTNHIKVSIIVASLNSEKNIDNAILSLQKQAYDNLEIIFVDGGSTDKTTDLIRKHNLKNSILISEPDRGIGDAWNKGLRICTGNIIGILNSDDYYDEGILVNVVAAFEDVKMPLIGFGDVTLFDSSKNTEKMIMGKMRGKLGLLNGFGFLHPSVFFNRKALEVNGLFNPRVSVAVDTDWLLRAITKKITFKKIPSHTYMLAGGHSHANIFTGMGEYMDSLVRNGYSKLHIFIFLALRVVGSFIRILKR